MIFVCCCDCNTPTRPHSTLDFEQNLKKSQMNDRIKNKVEHKPETFARCSFSKAKMRNNGKTTVSSHHSSPSWHPPRHVFNPLTPSERPGSNGPVIHAVRWKRHAIHTNKCSLLDLCRPATVLSTLSIKSAVGRSGKSRKGPWSLHFCISMHSPYCWSFNKHTDSSDCIISDPPSYIDMEPIEPDWGAHMMIKPCREREK